MRFAGNRGNIYRTTRGWTDYVRELGKDLQRLRNACGMSQEQVAYSAGLSRLQYQRLEGGGHSSPSSKVSNRTLKSLITIAEVLDYTMSKIILAYWPDLRVR